MIKSSNYFTEALRLTDLRDHQGLSNFTKGWEDERLEIIGRGKKGLQLMGMKVNRKKDFITFQFKSVPTYIRSGVQNVSFPSKSQGTKKVRLYTQQIRVLDFFQLLETKPDFDINKRVTKKTIREILEVADIQLSCNCMSFQFQGMNYILSVHDAAIYPEERYPDRWTKYHNDDNYVCKHLDIILSETIFYSYLKEMAEMVDHYIQINLQ